MAEALPSVPRGVLSLITPCVLPLVPGYLSACRPSRRTARRAGVGRRVARSSIPFILGFTTVFVVLGAGAAALGGILDANRRAELAGLVLVILGLAFLGLLPWPERLVAPGLLTGARRRGSGVLLGAAFAVCAAPCIGTVLASVLVLAGSAEEILQGSAILAAYSAGLALAFVLAAVAFVRAMGAFRWLRDHYTVIRVVSGSLLVLLGLAFFFHRDGWIGVGFDGPSTSSALSVTRRCFREPTSTAVMPRPTAEGRQSPAAASAETHRDWSCSTSRVKVASAGAWAANRGHSSLPNWVRRIDSSSPVSSTSSRRAASSSSSPGCREPDGGVQALAGVCWRTGVPR